MLYAALIAVGTFARINGQPVHDDHANQVRRLSAEVQFVRDVIKQKGGAEKATDATVHFSAIESLVPIARSLRGGSGPVLEMSSQYRLLLVYFAELAVVAPQHPELMRCFALYRNELHHKLGALGAQGGGTPLPSPEEYIHGNRECAGGAGLFPVDASKFPLRDAMVVRAIGFTYLHELGHIVLGHFKHGNEIFVGANTPEQKKEVFLREAARIRSQERAADAWAVQEVFRIGGNPGDILNQALSDFFTVSSGVDCWNRQGMDHAYTLERQTDLIDAVRKETPKWTGKPIPPELDAVLSDMGALRTRAERLLDCPADSYRDLGGTPVPPKP